MSFGADLVGDGACCCSQSLGVISQKGTSCCSWEEKGVSGIGFTLSLGNLSMLKILWGICMGACEELRFFLWRGYRGKNRVLNLSKSWGGEFSRHAKENTR